MLPEETKAAAVEYNLLHELFDAKEKEPVIVREDPKLQVEEVRKGMNEGSFDFVSFIMKEIEGIKGDLYDVQERLESASKKAGLERLLKRYREFRDMATYSQTTKILAKDPRMDRESSGGDRKCRERSRASFVTSN